MFSIFKDDEVTSKHFPNYWPFMRDQSVTGGLDSCHKEPATWHFDDFFFFFLSLVWTRCLTNSWVAGDLRCHDSHGTKLWCSRKSIQPSVTYLHPIGTAAIGRWHMIRISHLVAIFWNKTKGTIIPTTDMPVSFYSMQPNITISWQKYSCPTVQVMA